MKILVTGAKGFVGKNLCAQLNNIKDGKCVIPGLTQSVIPGSDRVSNPIEAVYEYDIDSTVEDLDRYCADCDFVFNLAACTI